MIAILKIIHPFLLTNGKIFADFRCDVTTVSKDGGLPSACCGFFSGEMCKLLREFKPYHSSL